jgi:hypothetical protein
MASPPSFLALAAGVGLGTSLEWVSGRSCCAQRGELGCPGILNFMMQQYRLERPLTIPPPALLPCCPAALLPCCPAQYDFALYSGLSGTITANFFPSGNAATAALAYW